MTTTARRPKVLTRAEIAQRAAEGLNTFGLEREMPGSKLSVLEKPLNGRLKATTETKISIPLTTSDIVEAAASQWKEKLSTSIKEQQKELADLKMTQSTNKQTFRDACEAAWKAYLASHPVLAMLVRMLNKLHSASDSVGSPEVLPDGKTPFNWSQPYQIQTPVHKLETLLQNPDADTAAPWHIQVSLIYPQGSDRGTTWKLATEVTAAVDWEDRQKLVKKLNKAYTMSNALTDTIVAKEAQIEALVKAIQDLPQFKERTRTAITMAALKSGGEDAAVYTRMLEGLVESASKGLHLN